jgi:hypothetical protein
MSNGTIFNVKYLIVTAFFLVSVGLAGIAAQELGPYTDYNTTVLFGRDSKLYGAFRDSWIGLSTRPSLAWNETGFELPWSRRIDLTVLTGINLLLLQVEGSSSSGSSDVLDDPRLKGFGRDEVGWTLTKSFINACWNLVDATFVAYYKFELFY